MDTSALRLTLAAGEWSIEYHPEFARQTKSGSKKAQEVSDLPGRALEDKDKAIMEFAYNLSEQPGWHFVHGHGVNMAHGAKSLRSPQPRFAVRDFPYRTSLARWRSGGDLVWRVIEEKVDLRDIANFQEQLTHRAERPVAFYAPKSSGNSK